SSPSLHDALPIAGHLDDFPYVRFVHYGAACAKASHPRLRMDDRGGNLGANVEIRCLSCDERRNIREVFGPRGAEKLPACRGRRAHLGDFASTACQGQVKLLVVGASNQWFPQTLSALAVPRTGASELQTKVEQHWQIFSNLPGPDMLPFARANVPALREFERWSDQEIWDAVERHRTRHASPEPDRDRSNLRTAEWEIFS